MITIATTISDSLLKAIGPDSPPVRKAKFRNFAHAAAAIRRDARQSLKRAPKEQRRRARRRGGKIVRRAGQSGSQPGSPPHTRGRLKAAIVFDATERGAVIGPRASVVGESASAHEFGGSFKGQEFPERPFMGPALNRNLSRFADSWAGSIGEQ